MPSFSPVVHFGVRRAAAQPERAGRPLLTAPESRLPAASGQPPVTRARAGSSRAAESGDEGTSVERLVEAVIVRLTETGLLTPAAPTAAGAASVADQYDIRELLACIIERQQYSHECSGLIPETEIGWHYHTDER